MRQRKPAQYGRFRGITRLAFALAFVLLLVVAYQTLRVPPPPDSDRPEFQAAEPPAHAGVPSVPPPPPPTPAAQRKLPLAAPKPAGRLRAQAIEGDPSVVVSRQDAASDADQNPDASPALTAAVNSDEDSSSGPVFVVPPERPKQESRGVRWIKAVSKALHIVPQRDVEEEAFRSGPGGQ